MELYPAIDLRGGRCVRLRQGDYAHETVYDEDPVAVAAGFAEAGARWIHVVDLDAARTGAPLNREAVAAIVGAVGPVGVRVQAGGGVRSLQAAAALWDAGVARVVVGTAAVSDPSLVASLAAARPDGVAVGIDTRDGEVAIRGWVEGSGVGVDEVVAGLAGTGVAAVILTDIGRDGMLAGPDLAGLQGALRAVPPGMDVIASGGVSSIADLVALAAVEAAAAAGGATGRRLTGAIVGKALYEGRFSVAEGVAACAASV
jgi:phosphoribosylformimino-5-aminoimidazole carboxamide ribotide isomerase